MDIMGSTFIRIRLAKYTYRPSRTGRNEVGTGDFLLGAYFALRLSGLEIIEAATIAGKLTEEFSNSEFLI